MRLAAYDDVQCLARVPWSVEDSASLYNSQAWGAPYFGTTDARDGRVVVKPFGNKANQADVELDLFDIAMAVREKLGSGGYQKPVS